jgi:hypothetical protein
LERQDLELPDESGEERRDVIAPFSPRAAMYDELILNNLLNTIRREHVRYVGIKATDIEDLIFLVQQIRAYCPDIVIFTTSADIRFLHSDVNTDLRGVLTFTTSPLFNEMQQWYPAGQSHSDLQTFSSDTAEGVYNAVLAQLGNPGQMLDYFSFGANSPYPALQIGVVGREEIWPLAFWQPAKSDLREPDSDDILLKPKHYDPDRPSLKNPAYLYPPLFQVLFFMLNVLFTLYSGIFLWGDTHPSWKCDWRVAVLLKEPPTFYDARYIWTLSLASGMLMAELIGLSYISIPVWFAAKFHHCLGIWLILVTSYEYLNGILVLVLWIVAVCRMCDHWDDSNRAGVYASLSLIPIGLGLWLVCHLWGLSTPALLFTFVRATHLYSGVSPLMVLIFVGIAGFALVGCHFLRSAMLEDRPLQDLLLDTGNAASFAGIVALQERIVTLLEDSPEKWPSAWALFVILGLAFLYFGLTKLRIAFSADGEAFDVLFISIGFGIYLVFSLALMRFALTWLAMRRLLRRLYFHPSRYSYKDIQLAVQPSHLEHQQIILFDPRPGLTGVEYALSRVREILWMSTYTPQCSQLPAPILANKALLTNVVEAEKQLAKLYKALVKSRNEPIAWEKVVDYRRSLYMEVRRLTKEVIVLFEPLWRMNAIIPRLQSFDDKANTVDDKVTPDHLLLQQAELLVAVRVVDFIRHVMPHLINLVGFAMPAVLAMVLAVSVYPFPAHDTLLWVSWGVLLATIALTLYVFVSINRNPILSMITGTEPGQFNWDSAFTVHFLLFAVIPILTLLGAQYPHALSGGLSWIGSVFGGGSSQ